MRWPTVYVIVPVHNRLDLTKRFLDLFNQVAYRNYRIVVVDDGSVDGTSSVIPEKYPHVDLIVGDGNLWWSGAVNRGVAFALERGADYILTANNDSLVTPTFLTHLVLSAINNPGAIVGSVILFADNKDVIWGTGGVMDWRGGRLFQLLHHGEGRGVLAGIDQPMEAEILTGNGTLIPAEVFRAIGLYDELWFPQYHGDSELTLRARHAGYRVLVSPGSIVYNETPLAPLVTRRLDIVLSKKSTYYWRPLVAIIWRYGPRRHGWKAILRSYAPFFTPSFARPVARELARRMLGEETR